MKSEDEDAPQSGKKRRRRRTNLHTGASTIVSLHGSKRASRGSHQEPPPSEKAETFSAPASSERRAATSSAEDMTDQEQKELKEAVLQHLREFLGELEERELLADFVTEMAAERKTRAEMVAELAFFHEEADPFVAWVEERRAAIQALSRSRRFAAPATSSASNAPRSSRTTSGRAQLTPVPDALDAGPRSDSMHSGQLDHLHPARKPLKAQLTEVAEPPPGRLDAQPLSMGLAGQPPGSKLVVITDRLVLQPNAQHTMQRRPDAGRPLPPSMGQPPHTGGPGGTPGSNPRSEAEDAKRNEVAQQKMLLLASMTKKLQEILARLSDKSLDDQSREKYQTLAAQIQAQMQKVGGPAKAPAFPTAAAAAAPATGVAAPVAAPATASVAVLPAAAPAPPASAADPSPADTSVPVVASATDAATAEPASPPPASVGVEAA